MKEKKSKKADLLVIRVNRQGDLCNAKPCRECTRLIQKTNSIRFVYFSNDQGEIECVRSNHLTSDKIALGTIFRSRGFIHTSCHSKLGNFSGSDTGIDSG